MVEEGMWSVTVEIASKKFGYPRTLTYRFATLERSEEFVSRMSAVECVSVEDHWFCKFADMDNAEQEVLMLVKEEN